tara:strand:- start:3527 stop:3844 length:318 start_codon:yes stop_codon:yes gene_type:complete
MPILIKVEPSKKPTKKYNAVFRMPENKFKTVSFGSPTMEDYLQHKDIERRERYLKRHERDLRTNDPLRAGFLSYYYSWSGFKQEGKPTTNKKKLIQMYNKKFFKH